MPSRASDANDTTPPPAGRIVFSYDASTGIRTATYVGLIDDVTLVSAYRAAISEPDFDPHAHDLCDLTHAGTVKVTPGGLGELGRMMSGGGTRPLPPERAGLAIVADTPLRYGLARMFEIMTQGFLPKHVRVFRDAAEALEWLRGLPRPRG